MVTEVVSHVVPLAQQPALHEAALHTHWPATHCWPGPHGAPMPHRQSPLPLQLSAVKVSHTAHFAPPNPQALVERALHVGPEQQPVVHVAAHPVHTPAVQLSPPGQLSQALPPLPHAPPVLPGSQSLPEQHPVAHEVPSQTQEPLRQRWPVTQAALLPHVHPMVAEHESASVDEQAAQVRPGAAHAASDRVVHTPWGPPAQQPVEHEVESQMHTPCEHCRPGLHGAVAPQRHVPLPSQVSLDSESQVAHVEPAAPHWASVRVSHVVPWQQPSGHDVPSHTHRPAAQRWPATHGALPPQVHEPLVAEHPSASAASHAMHTLPAAPHAAAVDGAWQSSPVQQPSGHWQPVQTPAMHACPDGQGAQATPAPPHCAVVLPGSHVLPLQHPVGHEAGLHTH